MRRGKRIFRPKRRYKIRRQNEQALKIITSVAAVAVLVFVGYSAAGPISRYIENRAAQTESSEWTPDTTDAAVTETAPIQQGDTPAQTAAPVQTEAPVQTNAPVQTESAVTSAPVQTKAEPMIKEGGAAYTLSAEDMTDRESLEAALDDVRSSGASAVILPMKVQGGYFMYATTLNFVKTVTDGNDPVRSELSAKDIVKAAKAKGLRPVAMISVLYDNNRYGDDRDGSYHCYDDGAAWLDGSPDKGGKPWLSPFEDIAQDYLCDIVRELGGAGFTEIICDDFIFPEFRSSDIDMLGDEVSPYSDRHEALTKLSRMMTDAGKESGADVYLRITANSIIKGYSEVFYPEELIGCSVMVDFSEDNISRTMISGNTEVILDDMSERERIIAVFAEVNSQCGDMKTAAMLDRNSMAADDFAAAVEAVSALGYEKYYVY